MTILFRQSAWYVSGMLFLIFSLLVLPDFGPGAIEGGGAKNDSEILENSKCYTVKLICTRQMLVSLDYCIVKWF